MSRQKITIPTQCPSCNGSLETVNQQLFCRNADCPAQMQKKLEQFTSIMGIKGLGPKTIEALELTELYEIYYLDLADIVAATGSEKTATKLMTEIEASQSADLATFLQAMGIPLVGKTASAKICEKISTIDDITAETCKDAGLGDKVTANLLNWLATEFKDTRDNWPFDFKAKKSSVVSNGQTVCITGKLVSFRTKAEAAALLTSKGFKVTDAISSKTSYLINESNKPSSKTEKASELYIPIITNLIDFLKDK
jgi:NAD-dependent DNA ligase